MFGAEFTNLLTGIANAINTGLITSFEQLAFVMELLPGVVDAVTTFQALKANFEQTVAGIIMQIASLLNAIAQAEAAFGGFISGLGASLGNMGAGFQQVAEVMQNDAIATANAANGLVTMVNDLNRAWSAAGPVHAAVTRGVSEADSLRKAQLEARKTG